MCPRLARRDLALDFTHSFTHSSTHLSQQYCTFSILPGMPAAELDRQRAGVEPGFTNPMCSSGVRYARQTATRRPARHQCIHQLVHTCLRTQANLRCATICTQWALRTAVQHEVVGSLSIDGQLHQHIVTPNTSPGQLDAGGVKEGVTVQGIKRLLSA